MTNDASLGCAIVLCAEGVVQVRAKLGELNEADLGTKMVDLRRMTSLLKGTPLRPPVGWSSWMVAATFHPVAESKCLCDWVEDVSDSLECGAPAVLISPNNFTSSVTRAR